jgi:hypothetical protein
LKRLQRVCPQPLPGNRSRPKMLNPWVRMRLELAVDHQSKRHLFDERSRIAASRSSREARVYVNRYIRDLGEKPSTISAAPYSSTRICRGLKILVPQYASVEKASERHDWATHMVTRGDPSRTGTQAGPLQGSRYFIACRQQPRNVTCSLQSPVI